MPVCLRKLLLCLAFLTATAVVSAVDGLHIKFRSRALLDATLSGYGKESVQGYYRLEDFRLGFKATYRQFELKAEAYWLLAMATNRSQWICLSVRQICVSISRQLRCWPLPTAVN